MALLGCLLALQEELRSHRQRAALQSPSASGERTATRHLSGISARRGASPSPAAICDVTTQQRKTGQGLEDAARSLRYACFAQAIPWDAKIATAHNAQDNLETMPYPHGAGSKPPGPERHPALPGPRSSGRCSLRPDLRSWPFCRSSIFPTGRTHRTRRTFACATACGTMSCRV